MFKESPYGPLTEKEGDFFNKKVSVSYSYSNDTFNLYVEFTNINGVILFYEPLFTFDVKTETIRIYNFNLNKLREIIYDEEESTNKAIDAFDECIIKPKEIKSNFKRFFYFIFMKDLLYEVDEQKSEEIINTCKNYVNEIEIYNKFLLYFRSEYINYISYLLKSQYAFVVGVIDINDDGGINSL